MPDILTFKEHNSSNFLVLESFTQFRGQLYAGLAEYLQTEVCSPRLSHLMQRSSCMALLLRTWKVLVSDLGRGCVCPYSLWYLRFCRLCEFRQWSCESWHHAARHIHTDVSEEHFASIFRVEKWNWRQQVFFCPRLWRWKVWINIFFMK